MSDGGTVDPGARRPPPRGRTRRILWRVAVLGAALLVAYVAVTFAMVYRASRHDGARPADAVIVLGAAQYDGRPSLVLRDRLDQALDLYEAGVAPKIVVTGGRQEGDRFTEAEAGYRYLRDRGVPDDDILQEVEGQSSYESLAAAARLLIDRGLREVVLVTDGYHAFRVRAIAGDLGLDAAVSPATSRLSLTHELQQLVRETAAVSVGRIIGWNRLFRLQAAVED